MRDPLLFGAVLLLIGILFWKLFRRGEKRRKEEFVFADGGDETLKKLLQEAKETTKHREVAKKIEELVTTVNDPVKKSYYYCSLAELYRVPLKNKNKAISLFIEALNVNPLCKDAYKGLERVLRGGRGAKRLEMIYWKYLAGIDVKKSNIEDLLWIWSRLSLLYEESLKKQRRSEAINKLISYIQQIEEKKDSLRDEGGDDSKDSNS